MLADAESWTVVLTLIETVLSPDLIAHGLIIVLAYVNVPSFSRRSAFV
jgi:hypothetical protein